MTRIARKTLTRLVAGTAVAGALIAGSVAAAPAYAQGAPQTPKYFDRKAVLARAETWAKNGGVPYSQTDWLRGYRTDCSGFISMAWNLRRSYVTWSLPEVAKPIDKSQLQPGDIMLDTAEHVILFGGWTNTDHSSYLAYEQVGGGFHRTMKRVVPYPYDGSGSYTPYRYTGGDNLSDPHNNLPRALVQTYAGQGQNEVPGPQAQQQNAQTVQMGERTAVVKLARIHAAERRAKAAREAAAQELRAQRRHAEVRAAQARARRVAQMQAAQNPLGAFATMLLQRIGL